MPGFPPSGDDKCGAGMTFLIISDTSARMLESRNKIGNQLA